MPRQRWGSPLEWGGRRPLLLGIASQWSDGGFGLVDLDLGGPCLCRFSSWARQLLRTLSPCWLHMAILMHRSRPARLWIRDAVTCRCEPHNGTHCVCVAVGTGPDWWRDTYLVSRYLLRPSLPPALALMPRTPISYVDGVLPVVCSWWREAKYVQRLEASEGCVGATPRWRSFLRWRQ